VSGFKAFLLRGNVVDLAIGIVIGAAFGTVITAFVRDLVTPLIAALGGKPDFGLLYFTINNSQFKYGDFINALIAFIIIAAVVYYLVVVPYVAFRARYEKAPDPVAPTKPCPDCLSKIPDGAQKCAFCGSPQAVHPS
jgi:large conductance mechanosensitive channel